ncbi:uncharacterized protein DEA37_0007453 [Paragonimus westermani]|uniref:Uncharacterized protein n=1 Tax=Paragonimus westermani TaxID=34504 RepID=A0A5J4N9G1_9TREM|nr:uncharacterized protein DEA37_0007453 [Paragonimus westermani]
MDVTQLPQSPEARRLANVLHEASVSNWNLRYLILIRGLPGSGKSTLARVVWICASCKGIPWRYVSLLGPLYALCANRVRVYGQLSRTIITSSWDRQGCSIFSCLFHSVMSGVLEGGLEESSELGVELLLGAWLTNMEYADVVVVVVVVVVHWRQSASECGQLRIVW